ncbi:MAG: penicillin-binding protein activator [Deltaproteobacteria bacterium]|nr:penicillin-binding protein activator [Deltaproteobacteria bacterium]
MKAVLVSLATALVLSCAAPAKPSELPGPANLPTEAQTGDARVELARAREAGDWTAALLALRVLGPKQGRAAEAETIVDGASYQQLEAAMAKMPEPGFPRSRVALRLGLLAQHIGRSEAAIRYLKMVRGSLADRAKAPLARASAELPATNVVAVLLPLSGRYAAVGRELRVAIEIAAAGEDRPLVFLDTAGDAERAAAMVDEAVGKHGAAAILGPVGDRESRAAAARAAELGVVIGLLGPGTDGPSAGVFGLVSSPEWEARAAAKTARLLGYKTAAILAPRDEHGRAAALHFARVAKGLGIRVVADGRYDPTATDLETDLKKFFGLDPKTNARLRRHLRRRGKKGWKSFSPDVAYEMLFIPDEYKRAALVASYLPYFNIEVRKRDLMNTYGLRRKHGGRLPSVVQLLGT